LMLDTRWAYYLIFLLIDSDYFEAFISPP
jgi:hypothetical protein